MDKHAGARQRMLEAPMWGVLVRLAVPGTAGALIQSTISIVEGVYLGMLGRVELAGVALVFPLYMLINMLSSGAVGGAVAGATARAVGANDRKGAEVILRLSMLIGLGGGAFMAAIVLGFGTVIFTWLGGQGAVLEVALHYSAPLFTGAFCMWLFNMLCSVLRGTGDTLRPAYGFSIVTGSHALIAAVLIFGWGPVDAYGAFGAGLALPLAFALGFLYLAFYFLRGKAAIRWRLGAIPARVALPVVRAGLLAGSQSFLTIGTALVATALIGRLGVAWLAGYGIGVRLEFLMIPVIFGIGAALIGMVGANVGAGQRARAISIAWRGTGAAAVMVGGIGLLCAAFPDLWLGMFTDDAETLVAGRAYLRIVGPVYAFFGLGLCLYFASQAMNSLIWPVLGALLRLAIIAVGGIVMTANDWISPESVFATVGLAMFTYGAFVAVTLRLGPWRR